MKEGDALTETRSGPESPTIQLYDAVDRGETANARGVDSYYANRVQTIRDGSDYHTFFCASGKPYIHGEGPAWWFEDFDQQQYARDRLFYQKRSSFGPEGGVSDAENIIFASMEAGSARGSPFFGPAQWRENPKHGACISSTVYYQGHYYTFFEKQHYAEHTPTTDKELLGIGVARTVGGVKPDVGVQWEILCDDGIWRVPSREENAPRKSVIVPAIMRATFGGKRSEDHVINNDYAEAYYGASAPCAVVVDDVLYVYYADDTYHVALLWAWREVYDWKPLDDDPDGSGSGNVLPSEDSPYFGRLDYVEEDEWPDEPRSYAKYRVAFRATEGEVDFFANADEIDLEANNQGIEDAAEIVVSPGYNGGFAPHQKIRYTGDIPGGAFLVIILKPDRERAVTRIQYLLSHDGRVWENPVEIGFLDYFDDRYVDDILDLSADWSGHISLGQELLFSYPRPWNNTMEVPVSDTYTHFYTGPLYAGGWNLYSFSAKLRLGPPDPTQRVPADREEDVFPDPRLRIDGIRRQDNWLFLHADRNRLSIADPALCMVFREDPGGNVSLVQETVLPYIWGPGETEWFTYSLHAAEIDRLLAEPGYFATLKVAHSTEPNEHALVAIPLSGDENAIGGFGNNYRPVSVHTIIPWVVPTAPESSATGVYFAGMLNPKAYDGKSTRIRLHWQGPDETAYPPVEYNVIDIETRPTDYWADPFLHAYVDKNTRVYYINLPKTAEVSAGSFRGDQDRLADPAWRCVAEILDGNNGSKDRLFVPLTAAML